MSINSPMHFYSFPQYQYSQITSIQCCYTSSPFALNACYFTTCLSCLKLHLWLIKDVLVKFMCLICLAIFRNKQTATAVVGHLFMDSLDDDDDNVY